ncbi:MAG: hypothetical protein ACTSYF_07035 [Promethearchaeota archaeon]
MKVKVRLVSETDPILPIEVSQIRSNLIRRDYINSAYIWHIQANGATTDGSGAPAAISYGDLSVPTNEADGTSTAITLKAVSASATDKDAADGAVREITVIGLDADGTPQEETIALDGTTAVELSDSWSRVIHAYAISWGTGGSDAAGNITIYDKSDDTVYLTITAGSNESNGCHIYFAENWNLIIASRVKGTFLTRTAATSEAQIAMYVPSAGHIKNTDPDIIPIYSFRREIGDDIYPDSELFEGTSAAYLVPCEKYIGGAETIQFDFYVITFGTTESLRGL